MKLTRNVLFRDKEQNLRITSNLPYRYAVHSGSLTFKFRTNEPDGLLLYNAAAENNQTSDFVAFELVDSQLYFIINLGSGALRLQVRLRLFMHFVAALSVSWAISSVVERSLSMREAAGSIPALSTQISPVFWILGYCRVVLCRLHQS